MRKLYTFRIKKIKKRALVLLLLLFIAFAALSCRARENNYPNKAVYALKAVSTEENIYALTANINGKEKKDDLELFLNVCEGLNIKITFFVTPAWLKKNPDAAARMEKLGQLGMLITKKLNNRSRTYTEKYIIDMNEDFYEQAGYYPVFVKTEYESNKKVNMTLYSFGQYSISAAVELNRTETGKIYPGAIAEAGYIGKEAPYIFAKTVSEAMTAGFSCVGLKEFVNALGSEVDENGIQYG